MLTLLFEGAAFLSELWSLLLRQGLRRHLIGVCQRPSKGPALRLAWTSRRLQAHCDLGCFLFDSQRCSRHCVRSDRVSHCVVTAPAWVRDPRGISMQISIPRFTAHSSFSILSYELQPPQQPSLPPLLTETVHLI